MSEPHEDVVARSRRLREAATPGPWFVDPVNPFLPSSTSNVSVPDRSVGIATTWLPNQRNNAALIAAAPALLAELEAEVERLRGRLAKHPACQGDEFGAKVISELAGIPIATIRRAAGLEANP